MRRILRFLIYLLGLQGAILALAQTPVPLPVQGNLGSISGSGVPYAGIDIQLQNCPSPVSITGYFGIIQQEYQVQADPSGVINTTVWPNDLITCNGTTGNSQYNLSLILNGVVQGTPQCYQVVSTQGVWNLNTQQPIACSQPAPNPQDKTFRNLNVTGFLQGNNADFTGSLTNHDPVGSSFVGNVNGICAVTAYGAFGDCSGSGSTFSCTNNHDAIQAAVDACYITRGSVYLPTNPAQSGQTVYYSSPAVNPKGVSFFGPPGASGASGYFTDAIPVAIRGGAGQDVFNVGDPADGGFITPNPSFTWKDFAILVDDSVDVSASNPNRRPGRTVFDGVMNGSNGVLTSATAEFQHGDVGQAITVAGAGSAGATLTTTIASWQSATQVTLTASSSTAVSGAKVYVSIYGLATTQNIGNCALVYPDRTGVYPGSPASKSVFRDFQIDVIDNTPPGNHTCGFFFQGNAGPTWTGWEDGFVNATFGYVFEPVSSVQPTSGMFTGIADNNHWRNVTIWSNYPMTMYSGELQTIDDLQIAYEKYGPHFVDAFGVVPRTNNLKLDIPEMEPENGCVGGNTSFRIAGYSHQINRLATGNCNGSTTTIQWDADWSTVAALEANRATTFNITGGLNDFTYPQGSDWISSLGLNPTGYGNRFFSVGSSNPYPSIQPGRRQIGFCGANCFGNPLLGRFLPAFNRTADFLKTGAANYYLNSEDLWLCPHEIGALTGTDNPVPVSDLTSPCGTNFSIAASGLQRINEENGTNFFAGTSVPAGQHRVYVFAKESGGVTNLIIDADVNYSSTWHSVNSCTVSVSSTSYAVYSCDMDTSSYSGDQYRIVLSGTTHTVTVGWVGITPFSSPTLSQNLQVGTTGVPMTDNQGNGTKIQHSTGTTTTDNCAKFDANGNTVDAGISCAFSSGSNSNGRWVTDPTGTITERGCVNVTDGGTTHVTGTITFPLTFPTGLDSLVGSPNNSPDGGDSGTAGSSLWFTSTSTSGATINYRCVVDVGGGGCAAITNTVPICWIAIGR